MSNSDKKVNIIQITDTHLFKDDNNLMFGVNTNKNFYQVIEKIHKQNHVNPDFFILTGDLSQDESEESYIKIVTEMERFNTPVYWIPGNHDSIEMMTSVFSQSKAFSRLSRLILQNWDIIFLNTKLEGTDNGYLSKTELSLLESELKKVEPHKSVSIIMHHHPIKVNTPLIDEYILTNPDEFWNIVDAYPNVKLIICGHVHGDYKLKHKNIYI